MPDADPSHPTWGAPALTLLAAVALAIVLVGVLAWNAEHDKRDDRRACAAVGGRLVDGACIDQHAVLTPEPR